ncbi:hypothetical protein [Phaeovulum veldkampii]|uniref:hypothetical protein n=1 Tax=Phaeovulum veldkampii TaxID=33049 RepID=UPI0019145EF6|nr:hypothetical protein [Phaeovulum veldkampii]
MRTHIGLIGGAALTFTKSIVCMTELGFKEARQRVIQSLKEGLYQHEARSSIEAKNLLATGKVAVAEVVDMLRRCNGTHHTSSWHHTVKGVQVHVIKPDKPDRWYIKFYFLDPEAPETMFISVHPEDGGQAGS